MAPMERKRSRDFTSQRPKKRQRIVETNGTTKAASKTVTLDSLPWNEVPLPDRLEDAEGFFGLEEVENIEVAKDPSSGQVAYRVGKAHWKGPRTTDSVLIGTGASKCCTERHSSEWVRYCCHLCSN